MRLADVSSPVEVIDFLAGNGLPSDDWYTEAKEIVVDRRLYTGANDTGVRP